MLTQKRLGILGKLRGKERGGMKEEGAGREAGAAVMDSGAHAAVATVVDDSAKYQGLTEPRKVVCFPQQVFGWVSFYPTLE